MPYITEISMFNYRSFVNAKCRLSPFTLVVGANNSGKSNFLKLFSDLSTGGNELEGHYKISAGPTSIQYKRSNGPSRAFPIEGPVFSRFIEVIRIDPAKVGIPEQIQSKASLRGDGGGVTTVLDVLKNGPREDLFLKIQAELHRLVPDITKLFFWVPADGQKAIQVNEQSIDQPVNIERVSEGTRIILFILTLIFSGDKPPAILLEDIDHYLHPRLFEEVVRLLRQIAHEQDVQIIATTHNPYLVNEFKDEPEAVVIVEKEGGESRLSNLDDRLNTLLEDGEGLEGPLGELWFTGLVGGVPQRKLPSIFQKAKA